MPHDIVHRLEAAQEHFRQSHKPVLISAYNTMADAAAEIRMLREVVLTMPYVEITGERAQSIGDQHLIHYAKLFKEWIPFAAAAMGVNRK